MLKPLSHFRIVDLSCVLAGPFSTQLLADFGAEVQKLEPPEGDPTRGWGPPFEDGDSGESAYFRCANRSILYPNHGDGSYGFRCAGGAGS